MPRFARRRAQGPGRDETDQLRAQRLSVNRSDVRCSQLDIAMGSGREGIMALRMTGALQLLDTETVAAEADDLDRIVATLYELAHRAA